MNELYDLFGLSDVEFFWGFVGLAAVGLVCLAIWFFTAETHE